MTIQEKSQKAKDAIQAKKKGIKDLFNLVGIDPADVDFQTIPLSYALVMSPKNSNVTQEQIDSLFSDAMTKDPEGLAKILGIENITPAEQAESNLKEITK